MTDQLKFAVDTSDLTRAVRALDQVAGASGKAEAAAGRFTDAAGRLREANGRFVSAATLAAEAARGQGRAHEQAAGGARQQTASLDRLGTQAKRVGSELRGLAAAVGLAFSAREAMNVADAYTTMDSRLRLVTQSEQERASTLRTLNAIADRTRTQVTDTAELYVKLRQANEGLGYSTQRTADLTEAFGLALKVSGASGATASSAITQFAQAMAKGAATGDEFVTISEAAPEVLRIVQKELGVSRARLLEMREAGELTSKVIGDALIKNLERLRGQVGDSAKTFADGFTALRNGAVRMLGASQDLQTATRNIAEGFERIGKFLAENGPVLVGVAKAAAAFFVATRAVKGLTGAVAALNSLSLAGFAASVVAKLGPIAAVLAPFAGFIARDLREGADAADRNREIARLAGLPAAERNTLAAGTVASLSAVDRRRLEVARLRRTDNSAALAAEEQALSRRRNQLVAQQLALREAGAFAGAGTADTGFTPPAAPGDGKKKKVPNERDFDLDGARRAYRDKLADFDRDIARDADRDNDEVRQAFARRAAQLAQDAAERARAITQAIVDGLQRTLADGLVGIFTRGLRSLGDFMEQVKQTILRTAAQIVANAAVQRLLAYLVGLGATARGGGSGTVIQDSRRGGGAGGVITSGLSFASSIGGLFAGGGGIGATPPIGGMTGGFSGGALRPLAVGGSAGGPTPMDGLRVLLGRRVPLLGINVGTAVAGAGAGLGGFAIGNALGRRFGTGGGIASGAATGALLGTIIPGIGNVVGAVVGGLAGAVGGLFGGRARRRQQRAEAEARRETETAFREDLAARTAAANGDDSEAARLRLLAQQRAELAQAVRQFGSASALVAQLRVTQAAELRALADSAFGPGTYLAPNGFSAAAARFEAGRPVTISGPVTIAVPEGTTQEQAVGLVRALQELATAQGLPASGWADVQVS